MNLTKMCTVMGFDFEALMKDLLVSSIQLKAKAKARGGEVFVRPVSTAELATSKVKQSGHKFKWPLSCPFVCKQSPKRSANSAQISKGEACSPLTISSCLFISLHFQPSLR